MGSRDDLHAAFVLHRRDFRNTSLIVELFVRRLGRVPAVAKGAKARKREGAGLFEPFRPLLVRLVGRGEMRTLAHIEPAGEAVAPTGRALYCGFYINELLMRLLGRNDPHEALFDDYHAVLHDITQGELEQSLRHFELRLLRALGYAPILDQVAGTGAPVEADKRYLYVPDTGLVPLASSEAKGYGGATLLALAADAPLEGASRREARHLMRSVLAHYLGDKPLKSRELFQMMQK